MSVEFSVPLLDIVNDLDLREVYVAENYRRSEERRVGKEC